MMGHGGEESPLKGATIAGAKVDPMVGPVLDWLSPEDAVDWLRENILVGATFRLSQLEAARKWIQAVSQMPESGLTKFDATILVDYARFGRATEDREKLAVHVAHLTAALDRSATSVQALCGKVERANKGATGRRKLSAEMVQVANRFVHLSRRWPR